MRPDLRKFAAGLVAIVTSLTSASAQTPPEQIRDLPGLSFLGVVAGLEAWSVEGSEVLWMRAPDGRALIRGDLFSAAGQDLGAALTGRPANPLITPASQSGPDWSNPGPELLAEVTRVTASETFWVLIGEEDAPEVWAWMDLSAPSTPATYMMLRERIAAGDISLRVVPVVTTEPGSADLMLRLLSQPDPLGALRDRVMGSIFLPEVDGDDSAASGMPDEIVSRIEQNGALAGKISPPGLPLLLWARDTGPTGLVGVPGEDVFEGAVRVTPVSVPDPVAGADAPGAD